MAGTVAHFPVLRKAHRLDAARDRSSSGSKDEVFDTFTKLHPYLKDNFFLQTKEEDSDPYESSQFSVRDRQRERHLRPVQLPRGVRVQGVLGHRLGPQLRAGRDARGLRQGQDGREIAEAGVPPAASSTATRPARCDMFTR